MILPEPVLTLLILSCRLIVSWILSGSKSRAPLHRQQQSSEAFLQATQRQVTSALYLHVNCALLSCQMYMCKSTGLSAAKTWPLNDGRGVRCNASAPGCFHTVLVVSVWEQRHGHLHVSAAHCLWLLWTCTEMTFLAAGSVTSSP